jgi:hypothetical protein
MQFIFRIVVFYHDYSKNKFVCVIPKEIVSSSAAVALNGIVFEEDVFSGLTDCRFCHTVFGMMIMTFLK